jgi:outer membrane cobalamin receptor
MAIGQTTRAVEDTQDVLGFLRTRSLMVILLIVGLGHTPRVACQHINPTEVQPASLDPVVVTATVVPTRLSQTTASVTVISRQQIEAQQAVSVTDLLRQVPGLHIDQPGARGSVSSVYLRGGDPNFTLVLIDGLKVNDPTNSRGGSFDFSTLSTDNIERIEIVRGPLSSVYGSDAISGVINIITRQGTTQTTGEADIAGGRFGSIHPLVQVRGAQGAADYALSASYLDNGEPVEGSEFRSTAMYTNVGVQLSNTMELRGVLRVAKIDSETFPDASGGPTFAVLHGVDVRDIQELTLGLILTHEILPWWEYRIQFGFYNREEDMTSPGVAPNLTTGDFVPPTTAASTLRRYDVTLQHVMSVVRGVQLAIGAQAQFEEGASTGNQDLTVFGLGVTPIDFHLSRDIFAPFVELQLGVLPGLSVQGGIRVDVPEGFDLEVSPRLGVSYTPLTLGTTLRVSTGKSFKLPSFFALGRPDVGNPNLKPEKGKSIEAGINQPLLGKRITIGATYFYNTFDNLIDFDTLTFRLVNRNEVTTEGVEMTLEFHPWSVVDITAHLTYVTTDVKGEDPRLRNRPKWRGGFTMHCRPMSVLDLNLQVLFVGDVLDFSVPTGERTLDAYTRVDLAVTWSMTKTWQLFMAIDNLLDAHYEEAIGFPSVGIRPRGGVRARF